MRFKRQEGSVIEKAAPMNCKPWMIKKDAVTEERSSGSEEIIALTAHAAGDGWYLMQNFPVTAVNSYRFLIVLTI